MPKQDCSATSRAAPDALARSSSLLAVLQTEGACWRAHRDDPAFPSLLARTAAAVDSLAFTRSTWVGLAELVRARARRMLGDVAGAREAAARAIVALEHGSGNDNVHTIAARAFRDSLTSAGAIRPN